MIDFCSTLDHLDLVTQLPQFRMHGLLMVGQAPAAGVALHLDQSDLTIWHRQNDVRPTPTRGAVYLYGEST